MGPCSNGLRNIIPKETSNNAGDYLKINILTNSLRARLVGYNHLTIFHRHPTCYSQLKKYEQVVMLEGVDPEGVDWVASSPPIPEFTPPPPPKKKSLSKLFTV